MEASCMGLSRPSSAGPSRESMWLLMSCSLPDSLFEEPLSISIAPSWSSPPKMLSQPPSTCPWSWTAGLEVSLVNLVRLPSVAMALLVLVLTSLVECEWASTLVLSVLLPLGWESVVHAVGDPAESLIDRQVNNRPNDQQCTLPLPRNIQPCRNTMLPLRVRFYFFPSRRLGFHLIQLKNDISILLTKVSVNFLECFPIPHDIALSLHFILGDGTGCIVLAFLSFPFPLVCFIFPLADLIHFDLVTLGCRFFGAQIQAAVVTVLSAW